jgi:exodeoxyribonuclease V gamma subunit
VQETGIRWGLDDGYPVRFDLPPMSGNSWLFGLRRMLLGFAMVSLDRVSDPKR